MPARHFPSARARMSFILSCFLFTLRNAREAPVTAGSLFVYFPLHFRVLLSRPMSAS
jgi:hypothetical protein